MDQDRWLQLRQQAEALVRTQREGASLPFDPAEFERLVEELNITHVELEIQNRELLDTQVLLENLTKEYLDLFDFSPIGKIIVNSELVIQKVNLTFAALVKAIRSRIVGTGLQQWLDPESLPLTREKLAETSQKENRSSMVWEGALKTSKREHVPVRFIARKAVGTMEGNLYLAVLDETVPHQTREENQILLERVRGHSLMDSLSSFAAGLSHEFNNVLAAIMGYAQVAQLLPNVDPRVRVYLTEILGAARRGKKFIEQNLGPNVLGTDRFQETSIDRLLEAALEKTTEHKPPHVEVSLEYHTEERTLLAPANQLQQALQHLILNAYEALRNRGKTLRIVLEKRKFEEVATLPLNPRPERDEYFYLCFIDDGEGIETKHLDRIFQPFFSTRERQGSKGLGLFLVYGALMGMGGSLFLNSSPDSGTQVHLFLPRGHRFKVQEREPIPFGGLEGLRVLFLDDEPSLCLLFREIFEIFRMEGRTFSDPRVFLEEFHRDPRWPHVVLIDLEIGSVDVESLFESLREIRADLLLGGLSGLPSRAMDRLSVPVLSKPFEIDDVYEYLKRLTQSAASLNLNQG